MCLVSRLSYSQLHIMSLECFYLLKVLIYFMDCGYYQNYVNILEKDSLYIESCVQEPALIPSYTSTILPSDLVVASNKKIHKLLLVCIKQRQGIFQCCMWMCPSRGFQCHPSIFILCTIGFFNYSEAVWFYPKQFPGCRHGIKNDSFLLIQSMFLIS